MFVKSANLQTHMKSVHKKKLKPKRLDENLAGPGGKDGALKGPRDSTVSFPWKWLGAGTIVLILVFAVIIIRPSLSSNPNPSNNGNLPAECVRPGDVVARYTFTLRILKTDTIGAIPDYNYPISYGIGKLPFNGTACTRKMYTSDVGPPFEYNDSSQPAIIHVESPTSKNTLGDFFKIWDQELNYSRQQILSYINSSSSSPRYDIVMKVNEVYSGVWERLETQPSMSIVFYVTRTA